MWWQWLFLAIIFSPPLFVILMIILDALDPDAYIAGFIQAEKKMRERESRKEYKRRA